MAALHPIYHRDNCSFCAPLRWGLTVFWRTPIAGAPWLADLTRALEREIAALPLVPEGRSVLSAALHRGHAARLTLSTYGHVMDEFEDTPRLDAQTAIAEARAAVDGAATSTS